MVEVLLIVWVLLLSLRLCGWQQGMSSAPMLLSPGDKGMPCHPPVGAGGESESEVFSLITYLCLNKIYFVILPGNSNPLLQLEDSNLLLLLLLITTTIIFFPGLYYSLGDPSFLEILPFKWVQLLLFSYWRKLQLHLKVRNHLLTKFLKHLKLSCDFIWCLQAWIKPILGISVLHGTELSLCSVALSGSCVNYSSGEIVKIIHSFRLIVGSR